MPVQIYRNVLLLVGELHRRGYEKLRIYAGLSPAGGYWRCSITHAGNISHLNGAEIADFNADSTFYTTEQEDAYFGWKDVVHDSVAQLADKFIERFPEICAKGKGADPAYAAWYRHMLNATEPNGFPIAYGDFDVRMDCLEVMFYRGPDEKLHDNMGVPFPPPGEAPDS